MADSLDRQKRLNLKHLKNPQVGDYWHEMLVPVLVVLDVDDEGITVCKRTKQVDNNHWTWDLGKYEKMSREDFQYYLSRAGDPERGQWAKVVPGLMAWASDEWFKKYKRKQRKLQPVATSERG